jgi:translation initiation factor 3 subunit B
MSAKTKGGAQASTSSYEGIRHKITDDDELEDFPDAYQILGEDPVELDKTFSNCIIVDNLPTIPMAKYDKLLSVLKKIYAQVAGGEVVQIFMPEEEGQTKGFAFIEFTTAEAARNAVTQTNGYKLDRSHIFKVNYYEDFNIYEKVTDTFQPVDMAPYKPKENLLWWLIDEEGRARDQFALRYENQTEIMWGEGKKRDTIFKKKDLTETYVTWSPYGTYLSSFHRQGVILWGTDKWEKLGKFPHPGVKLLDFSPKENYLVTFSSQFQNNDNPKDPQCIIVWDTRSRAKKRGFVGTPEGTWPAFKWSHDEKYFARLSDGAISIYETPSMQLLDKKSLKIPGVKDFCWSPTDNIIACWVPEMGDKPAQVTLISIPSRKPIRSHNLFNVLDCNLHWHKKGHYLCVKIDRKAGKKSTSTTFELYRMREKDIPIEALEMKEPIVAFAWEPKGDRFAIVHGSGARNDVSFYTMRGQGNKHALLKTLEKRQVNHLFWSPKGGHIVLAGFGTMGGILEFYNVDELESIRTDSHLLITDLAWDTTGRFVATSTSHWRHQLDNGFTMWTFQGKNLYHVPKDKFYQLLWRPRPPSLLSKEKRKEIKKNLSVYARKYKKQDLLRRRAAWEEWKRKREAERAAWYAMKEQRLAERQAEKPLRDKLRGYTSEEEEEEYEEIIEEVAELTGEPVVEVLDY